MHKTLLVVGVVLGVLWTSWIVLGDNGRAAVAALFIH